MEYSAVFRRSGKGLEDRYWKHENNDNAIFNWKYNQFSTPEQNYDNTS